MIETLDDFAKTIFEDEELFNNLCDFVEAAIKLSATRSEATDKILKRIYEIEEE